jgi:hypothetical protein
MLTLQRTRPESCLSNLSLDRLLAHDLDVGARARAEDHLAGCAACRERRDRLAAEVRDFQASGPPRALTPPAPQVPAARAQPGQVLPLRPRRRVLAAWGAGAGALLAAAAVLLLVRPSDTGTPEVTRRKGADGRLGFFVKRGAAVSPGAAGVIVHPDDRLRFTYTLDRPGYVAVLSVDGAGVASVYYPDTPEAAAVPAGLDQPLPASTILDDTLGPETLYGLFCDQPVVLEPVRAALAAAPAAPDWPAGCTAHALSIEKRTP